MGMSRYYVRHDTRNLPLSNTTGIVGFIHEPYSYYSKEYCYCSKTDGGECAKKQRLPVPSCNCKCHTKTFQPVASKTRRKKK